MARDLARYFKPGTYLYKFFDEKDIGRRGFDVKDSQGLSHDIPLEVVVEAIAGTRGRERAQIEDTLRKIDFHNGDVRHFLEHLAKGLAEQYSGAMRFAGGPSFSVLAEDVKRALTQTMRKTDIDMVEVMNFYLREGIKAVRNPAPWDIWEQNKLASRVARRWLNAGFNWDEFDYEGKDFGVQVRRSWGDDSVYLYYPLENIGRRGRKVTKIGANFRADPGGVAWAHTYLDRVKKVSNARAAVKLLDDTVKEARSRGGDDSLVSVWDRELKGVDKSLPTPTSQKIDDIEGRNIRVDVNAKPMRVYDTALADELEKSFQRYTFEIPHRFKKQVHAIRDEIAAARSYKEVEKILSANKIRYDFNIHMDPMYQ